jgi:hypothetical protein
MLVFGKTVAPELEAIKDVIKHITVNDTCDIEGASSCVNPNEPFFMDRTCM